jgi:hypothetical protein
VSTIQTTTNATPFQYPGNRLLTKINGLSTWLCMVKDTTSGNYDTMKSTDGGASWTNVATVTLSGLQDMGSIFSDDYGWTFWAYRTNESSQDKIYFRRFNQLTNTWSNQQQIAAAGNGGVAGTIYTGLDVVTHYNTGTGWHHIAVAVGTNSGGNHGVSVFGGTIDPSGNLYDGNYRFSGTKQWLYSGSGRIGPTLDVQHTGDGYNCQDSNANLWLTFGRSWLRMIKIPWSGDGWTGGSTTTTLQSTIAARDTVASKWDGHRYLIAVADPTNTDQVMLIERNSSNSTTTIRRTGSHPQGAIRQCTLSYDSSTGNTRIWAVGTTTAAVYYIDYIRGTGSWTTWTSTGFSPLGTNVDNWGVRIGSYQTANYALYYATSGTPNTCSLATYGLSYSPNTPTWVTPNSGDAQDVGQSLPLDWLFSDPDAGDSQTAYAVSRQIGSGTLAYWRASDSTWQPAEVMNTSGASILTLASGWAAATDAPYTFKAKVWDTGSNPSGYSAGLVVVPSTPVNPTISTPTAAQVLTANSVTATWTAAEQTLFRWILVNTTSGSVQVYDSGWVTDSVSRTFTFPVVLPNATSWTIKLQTKNNEGLASSIITRNFTVSYTPPATPTLAVNPVPAAGWISVAIANPTPGGSQPAIATQDVYRRVVGDTSAGIRIATGIANNATYNDWHAVSGINYQYQAVAFGVNGTSTSSAWTT